MHAVPPGARRSLPPPPPGDGTRGGRRSRVAVDAVTRYICSRIERGDLKPGDRLPPERDLAAQLGVSRPTVRTALRSLATMGVLHSKQGAGTFITDGPPALASEPLGLLAALHGLSGEGLFEARLVLEVGSSALAADRASGDDLAAMSEEVTGMFASVDEPLAFLRHDVQFHRAVATASRNPVLGVLIDMLGGLFYERRRETIQRATDLREAAEAHRRIFKAIRAGDREAAIAAMSLHLRTAKSAQTEEPAH